MAASTSGPGRERLHRGLRGIVGRAALVASRDSGRAVRAGILFIDSIVSRAYRVRTFTDDPECILRLSARWLEEPSLLADGTELGRGALIIEIHFWNEHLPKIAGQGADLPWGRTFARLPSYSFRLLAENAMSQPRYQCFAAVHGEFGFMLAEDVEHLKRMAELFGLELRLKEVPGLRFWTGAFWAQLYSWWLMWTFNPNTLRGKRLGNMARSEVWASREAFLEKYLPEADAGMRPV